MYFRIFNAAAMAVFLSVNLGASSVSAQTVASVGGPAEMPPADFNGEQFVDSRGCLYLKAGLSGQINWVLRVGSDRKPLCNQSPTFGSKPVIEVATAEEAAVPEVMADTVAVQTEVVTKPAVRTVEVLAKPIAPLAVSEELAVPTRTNSTYVSPGYQTESGGNSNRKIGCFSNAPVPERVKLRSGGTAVVCTRGDGSLTGWRSPIYADGSRPGASLSDPPTTFVAHGNQAAPDSNSGGHSGGDQGGMVADRSETVVPKGYKLAWDDGRLNSQRGKGTARGWADQDQVWTRDIPAVAVSEAAQPVKKRVATSSSASEPAATRKSVSTKSTGGKAYIQVGTFGVASNADGAASRLQDLGLPVARAKFSKGGKALQIVMAGPFASASDAQSVLGAVRGAGFGDAFVK